MTKYSKIKCIWQAHGSNVLTVEYKSGVCRYSRLGDHYYTMTKTQRAFLENAVPITYNHYTEWRCIHDV